VCDGRAVPQPISLEEIQDERFLKPVLPDDALIFCLDELIEEHGSETASSPQNDKAPALPLAADLVARNAELREELEKVKLQFGNYRLAVEETLDQRWGEDRINTSGESSSKDRPDMSDKYFESYSYNGMI
jgi:hypothetical protein